MKIKVVLEGSSSKSSTLVVFSATISSKDKRPSAPLKGVPKQVAESIKQLWADKAYSGAKDESAFVRYLNLDSFKNLLVVGLGEAPNEERFRRAASTAFQQLKAHKVNAATFSLETLSFAGLSVTEIVRGVTEGLRLSEYAFDDYKIKDQTKEFQKVELKEIEFMVSRTSKVSELEKTIAQSEILAEATNFARWLGDNPGNKMTPALLAEHAQKQAKGTGIKVTVWDKARIKKEKFGGLLGVSLGSSQDPRFIIMEYTGTARKKKRIVLVGKGLTFDSGGISIKPSQSMDEMKYDMCGGANVIGAILAIARLKLRVNVTVMVPATENMPGPSANKPGDILTARNGKTMEVLNTDAEGRLILADALAYASEQKPALILNAATLTGAVVIALGNSFTGVFTRDQNLMKEIQKSADHTGEPIWPMPLCDDHLNDIKSDFADVANISSFHGAGSSTAAAFLEHFVDKEIPWAHFDIAGSAWNIANRVPYAPKKGASGAMVRTFVQIARDYFRAQSWV